MKKIFLAVAAAGIALPAATFAQTSTTTPIPGANTGENTSTGAAAGSTTGASGTTTQSSESPIPGARVGEGSSKDVGSTGAQTTGAGAVAATPETTQSGIPGANVGRNTSEEFVGAMTANRATVEGGAIRSFSAGQNVTVVSAASSGISDDAFNAAVEANAESAAMIRQEIAGSEALSAALRDAGVSADQVQAIGAGADGALIVYTD